MLDHFGVGEEEFFLIFSASDTDGEGVLVFGVKFWG